MTTSLTLRLAETRDVVALEALIPLSTRALQAAYYSPAQIEGALGSVFAVDRQLIADGTYFVTAVGDAIVGCGGWSKRRTLYGGDAGRAAGTDTLLDPDRDAARIRAFFVHPQWARRGIGRQLLRACEEAAAAARFARLELVATLAGEPLYAAAGYRADERFDIVLANGLNLPAVRMSKQGPAPGLSGVMRAPPKW
jgi:GNAT superfamily N-acetyltransferase